MNRDALGPEPQPVPDVYEPEPLPFDDEPIDDAGDWLDDPRALGSLPVCSGRRQARA